MGETSTCSVIARTKSEVIAMKETLCAQQQLLQKLYAELDEEREASATAASETLDMILRLQGEKAAVKMEASHFKRMAEEKIGHAEVSLEAYEELVYQKEMEIASLEFQVQAYKHKLLSLGCDFNASEFEFPEDLLLNRSDQQNGENGQSSNVRRLHSMPPIQIKSSLRVARKRERSPSPVPVIPVSGVIPKVVLESNDQEATPPSLDLTRKSVDFVCGNGTLDSYWNQIKMLDEQLRVISDCTEGEKGADLISRRGRSCSIFPQASTKITSDQTDRLHSTVSDEVNHGESTHDRKAVANPPSLPNVHDVFEVQQSSEKHEVSEHGKKRLEKWNSEAENRLTKPDCVSEGIVEPPVKYDADKQKGMLRARSEIKKSNLKDMMTKNGQKKERMDMACDSQAEFQKLQQRIERLEMERNSSRHEITQEGNNGEEQLRMLKDIQSQLKLIQSEMRSWKTKEATPMDDDVSLGLLQEAMLHFWL